MPSMSRTARARPCPSPSCSLPREADPRPPSAPRSSASPLPCSMLSRTQWRTWSSSRPIPTASQGRLHRAHLREDVDAVLVLLDHALQPADLPLDPAETILQVLLVHRVAVHRAASHPSLRRVHRQEARRDPPGTVHAPDAAEVDRSVPSCSHAAAAAVSGVTVMPQTGSIIVVLLARASRRTELYPPRVSGPPRLGTDPMLDSPHGARRRRVHAGRRTPHETLGLTARRPPRDVPARAHGAPARRGGAPPEPDGPRTVRRPGRGTRGLPDRAPRGRCAGASTSGSPTTATRRRARRRHDARTRSSSGSSPRRTTRRRAAARCRRTGGIERLGIITSSSPIATQVPHAAGIAYAVKYRGEDAVVASLVRRGRDERGRLARGPELRRDPQAPGRVRLREQPLRDQRAAVQADGVQDVADRAEGYGFPGVVVDGNDVLACYAAMKEAHERARAGEGPTLIECKTYRFLAHTSDDDDKTYRTRDEVEEARHHDPVDDVRAPTCVEQGLLDDARRRGAPGGGQGGDRRRRSRPPGTLPTRTRSPRCGTCSPRRSERDREEPRHGDPRRAARRDGRRRPRSCCSARTSGTAAACSGSPPGGWRSSASTA